MSDKKYLNNPHEPKIKVKITINIIFGCYPLCNNLYKVFVTSKVTKQYYVIAYKQKYFYSNNNN